jgi:hypothetical protein
VVEAMVVMMDMDIEVVMETVAEIEIMVKKASA